MQEHFTISLPLHLGLDALKHHPNQPPLKATTSDCQIAITIPSNIIVGLTHRLSHNIAHLRASEKNWLNNLFQVSLLQTVEEKGQMAIHLNEQNPPQYALFPFRINLKLTKQTFHVNINKLALQLKFIPVPKAKFVKNQILQNAIKHHQGQSWGLITMDQVQRIVLEPQNSAFPAIGIWISQKQLTDLQNIQKIVKYSSLKLQKKCRFVSEGRKFIYVAHISETNKTPDLYIAQWKSLKEVNSQLDFPLKEINRQNQLIVRSDQHSHLQFTLRSDEKIPTKLQNIECSPIFFEEQSQTSLDVPLPDSPRFSQPQKGLEVQCTTLRRLVKMQHQEIVRLKKQLLRLSSATTTKHYDFNSAKTRSSPLKKGKMLTEKDLSLGSMPRSDPSTLSSSDPQGEWSPWEHFQIVEK